MKKFFSVFLMLFIFSAGNVALANEGSADGSEETAEAPKEEAC